MRILTLLICFAPLLEVTAQQVLHFTRTSGWDHQTRSVSYAMFLSIGQELAVGIDDDATGDPFSDPATLASYAVVVFSNTSGDNILNAQQRTNFESWVANGGHVLGIHAASDTYRHSTANGNNTGAWDFYAELIGASVQENPNHVNGTPPYALTHIVPHASTANLPDPWVKNEEYYYWEGGYYRPDNVEVLRVEETIGPNGQVNSYDAPRPMSWYRELPNGSRVFYTALGHDLGNYTNDLFFRAHIKDALGWLLAGTTGMRPGSGMRRIRAYPNPASDLVNLVTDNPLSFGQPFTLFDIHGRTVLSGTISGTRTGLNVERTPAGSYSLRVAGEVLSIQIIR